MVGPQLDYRRSPVAAAVFYKRHRVPIGVARPFFLGLGWLQNAARRTYAIQFDNSVIVCLWQFGSKNFI